MPPPRKISADWIALVAYFALAIVLTFPLALHAATHVAGDGSDDPALAWNLWWVPFSLLHNGTSPIYTNYMFYPIGLNLAFYTLTYLNALLSIPIQFTFNTVLAANLNLWLSFALSGFGTYLLVKRLIRPPNTLSESPNSASLIAFAAGALYAFSANKFLYASLGQFNIASSHWIPFYILFLVKLTDIRSANLNRRQVVLNAFMLGLFLLFQALSELIFASFLILFTLIYLACWLFINRRNLSAMLHPLRWFGFIVAAVTFVLPMLPILVAMIEDMLAEGDFIQRGLGFADIFSSDAIGFFVPSRLHPIFGSLAAQFHFAYTNFAYLGFVALILALLALWKVPGARIWGVFGLVLLLTSLGPSLHVNGARFDVPLPFRLLLEIPIVKGNRYPSRWSVMVTMALAILVGYGMVWLCERLKRKSPKLSTLAPLVVLFLSLFEHLAIPIPLSNFQIPQVYAAIAQDQQDLTVLEIPLAWRNGFRMTGTLDQAMMFAQWYQTEHHHPILGGNTSRNPELKFQYFAETPVINSIIAAETGHLLTDAAIQRDRQIAPDVLRFFGVRYIVWHSPRSPQNRAALDAVRAYVQYVLPVSKISEISDDTGETVAFRVADGPTLNQQDIRPTDPLARPNFAEGWGIIGGKVAWATRYEAKMFVRYDSPSDATLSIRALAPMPNQTVTVILNGHAQGTVAMQQGWNEYPVPIARGDWRAGMNEIILRFSTLVPAATVREGDYTIGGTDTAAPVSIAVQSAGSEIGDFAHIFVNGLDVAQNLRGYNIVVVNERTGAVEASAVFDTFASAEESARLERFIQGIPTGRIVAVSVRDEASRNLTREAVDALRSIGAREDLSGRFRWSHAVIGVKGALNPVPESASEVLPAKVVVGIGATEPNIAAAIEWIKIQ